MSMKVKDLAKELGIPSEEILEQIHKLYIDAEDENSKIDEKIVGLIRIKLGIPEKSKKEPKKVKKTKKKTLEKKEKKKEKSEDKEKKELKEEKKVLEEEKTSKIEDEEKLEKIEEKPESKIKKVGKIEIKPEKPKIKPEMPEKSEKILKSPEELIKEKVIEEYTPSKKHKKGKKTRFDDLEVVNRRPRLGGKQKKGKAKPLIEIVEKGSGKNKKGVKLATPASATTARKTPQKIEVHSPVNIRTLAPRINVKPNIIIQYLMGKGAVVNINQDLDEDVVRDILNNFGYELELPETIESMEKELVSEYTKEEKAASETRAPIVTFMGHVDHGKTSLLDYIRNTMVTKSEKGGITQHIGAYKVETAKGSVTFLDTPGHAAFTAMRARGANVTDVVVLVVAADDGVMPQTKEAIDHARAADVPIVVAINKCDLPGANPDNVKRELQAEGLDPESWGGDTIMVEVSAVTGDGVNNLVEMLMLESEMLELKANPNIKARGVVIEGKKTPGQGVVATFLVKNGTLYSGDIVLVGSYYGKIKAMLNNRGQRVKEAPPATPVEVLGLQGVPEAGEEFFAVKDEKKAKTLSILKQSASRKSKMAGSQRVTLEDLHSYILEGNIKELKIILKSDVQGSEGALKHSLEELSTSEVKLDIIHSAVGNINESDVMLAMVSNAVIIGFHVKIETKAEELAKNEKVDYRIYDIIYEAIADVKAALEGLLEPEEKEVFQGRAQILEVFSAKGTKAAGCSVIKGAIHRKDRIRVKRGQEIVHDGTINALKRFKDDVKEVREGFECGITIKGFNDIRTNDIIEAYIIEKIARRLEK